MSLLIFTDTVNPGTYGYNPSVTGQIYVSLNNFSSQSATVAITVTNNGQNVVLGNVTIAANSSYTSDPFTVNESSMLTIQSNKSLQLNLSYYYADFVDADYVIDDNYTTPVESTSTSSASGTSSALTGNSLSSKQIATINSLLTSIQTQFNDLNSQYQVLFSQYSNISDTTNINTTGIYSLSSDFQTLESNIANVSNQVNSVAITQNLSIIQGSNSLFKSIAAQTSTTDETISDPITLQGVNSGNITYVIIKNSIYQKLVFSFNNYINDSSENMTINFPYSYIYNPFINNPLSIPNTVNLDSISFTNSDNVLNGVMVVEGFISNSLNDSTYYQLNGQSSGTIDIYYTTEGNITKYIIMFNQYMNNTNGNQVITLPVAYSNSPLINNTTELAMTVSNNILTIVSPSSTVLYTGMVILEGI